MLISLQSPIQPIINLNKVILGKGIQESQLILRVDESKFKKWNK